MRVLIVDDEVNLRFAIERRLRKAGMETGSASTVRHAIDRLRNEPYDVVLCDLRMPGGNGTQLLQWLGSYSPSTKIIVISAFVTPEFRKIYQPTGRLRIVEKPIDLDVLVETLEEFGPRKGFYGNAIEVELFDYVQMIALSGRDKLVEVTTPTGKGLIWFEHGDIVHVEYDQYRGEMAFYKLLGVNRGTFKEVFNREAPMQTVVRSSTHLLMEAARRSDEGILGEDPEPDEHDDETSFGDVAEELAAEDPGDVPEVPDDVFEEPEPELGVDPFAAEPEEPSPGHDPDLAAELDYILEFDTAPSEPAAAESGRDLTFHSGSPAGLPVVDDDDLVDPFAEPEVEVAETRAAPPPRPTPAPARGVPKPKPKPKQPSAAAAAAAATSDGLMSADDHAVLEGLTDVEEAPVVPSGGGIMSSAAMFEDPDMRAVMLEQFWQFDGINGVAIISSTGKILAEDMRNNSSLVTLAGFYMRGAARLARTLGYNVFDGVVARSVAGQQMVMVSMGAASAVLSVEPGTDPEGVRDAVMGVE
ncbi:response regulator [Paraliomyxa miuraensis]|uniref:response regulator n=1 Tax=Paraliomyxa miuraensis TaxID=376150 RepID=UPI002252561E|nr:response regulator [Paraliomyxa miuraensis]MCX4247209.1 response regulator [Paraliomyxa miuraensis]